MRTRSPSESEQKLALNTILGCSASLNGNIKVPGRIVLADFVLNVQQGLPLQEGGQPEIKAHVVGPNVYPRVGSHLGVGYFREHGIGVLIRERVNEADLPEFFHLPDAEPDQEGIARKTRAHVARPLRIQPDRKVLPTGVPTLVDNPVIQTDNLKAMGPEPVTRLISCCPDPGYG